MLAAPVSLVVSGEARLAALSPGCPAGGRAFALLSVPSLRGQLGGLGELKLPKVAGCASVQVTAPRRRRRPWGGGEERHGTPASRSRGCLARAPPPRRPPAAGLPPSVSLSARRATDGRTDGRTCRVRSTVARYIDFCHGCAPGRRKV